MPQADDFATVLADALRHLGVAATPDQLQRLSDHFDLLLEGNRQFNLTRITDPVRAARLLYADSAAVLAWAAARPDRIQTVLDVGTGGGFPAVPLAVLAPRWRITALEATRKKAAFVERSAARLGITNLRVVHAHGSHWKTERPFDLVTFKAVAALDVCLVQARRYVAADGHVAIYKTASLPADEAAAGRTAARRLRFTELPTFQYEFPGLQDVAGFALCIYKSAV